MSKYTVEDKYEFLCKQLALVVQNVLNAKGGTMEMHQGGVWFTFDEIPKTPDEMVEQAMTYWKNHIRFDFIQGLT